MGTILAPNTTEGWTNCYANTWLGFWNVSNLIVNGSGEINGSGSIWWKNFSIQVWNSFYININSTIYIYIYIYMRLVQLKNSLRQMILFSQTGRKPWLPISYIMRNMERERERERDVKFYWV